MSKTEGEVEMTKKYCITPQASILDAMKKIDASAIATVMVCEGRKIKGVLTDGDIRRALIDGALLTDPIERFYTRNFTAVTPEALRADVLELMQARVIEQIPIISEDGELMGIHTMHSILGHETKPNWAVIMAGGKGIRLGELTTDTPKPMLRVAGKPILERLILHAISYGIRNFYLAVNHLSHVIEDYFENGAKWGCTIEYLREDKPLGSGGALSLLPERPENPLIVMNGDLLTEVNISQMLAFHENHSFYATIGVHYYSHEVPFGCIQTDGKRIRSIEEKPLITKIINGGIYVLSPDAVRSIPADSLFPATQIFKVALEENKPCGAYPLDGEWIDVGMPKQLRQARGLRD